MTEVRHSQAENVSLFKTPIQEQVKDWFIVNGGRSEEFDLFQQLCREIVEFRASAANDPAAFRAKAKAAEQAAAMGICFMQIAKRYDFDILAAMRVKAALKRTDGCLLEGRQ